MHKKLQNIVFYLWQADEIFYKYSEIWGTQCTFLHLNLKTKFSINKLKIILVSTIKNDYQH